MASIGQPPRKKRKISRFKSIVHNDNGNTSNSKQQLRLIKGKKKHKKSDPESDEGKDNKHSGIYYYTLHVNTNIILRSTDPLVPCNSNFDFEDINIDPNLFIVKSISSKYNVEKWLNYHENICDDIVNASSLLSNNKLSLLIITGAGMGCDSSLPDYRSSNGFWANYKPFKNIKTNTNLSLYDMSKTEWFNNDPEKAWGFYTHRSKLYRDAVPHNGYNILLNLIKNDNKSNKNGNKSNRNSKNIKRKLRDYYYMTSNIDGQVVKSGFNISKIYQTHGSLHYIQCIKYCKYSNIKSFNKEYDNLNFDENTFKIADISQIPKCSSCKSLMRPNVSFFTDTYNTFNGERTFKQKNKFIKWLKQFTNKYDNINKKCLKRKRKIKIKDKNQNKPLLIMEIGCGKSIHSLRWESEYLKRFNNVTLIRINPTENIKMSIKKKKSKQSRHITLKLPAKIALETIAKYMK